MDNETAENSTRASLRAKYKIVTGEDAQQAWSRTELQERIDAAVKAADRRDTRDTGDQQGNVAPPDPPPAPAAAPVGLGVQVILTCKHVYLPYDPLAENWQTATTEKVLGVDPDSGNRVRRRVHPGLAAVLERNRQAEII